MRGEFHEHSNEVRHAVASPIPSATLPRDGGAVSGGEARARTLSSLQEGLSDEDKLTARPSWLMLINQVGVNVNAAVAHPWQQHLLNHVAGLVPAKPGRCVGCSRRDGALESRAQLVNELGVLGGCVFRNAAVALRVVDDEVLVNTRIHPDNYVQVLEAVANALDYDFDQFGGGDDVGAAQDAGTRD